MLNQIWKSEATTAAASLLGAMTLLLAGCYGTMQTSTYPYPQPAYVGSQPVYAAPYGADDYIYYPDAEVYYSTSRHEYIYPQSGRWVRQYQAPRVSVWGPSVHLTFRDGPERHHEEVRRQYPRNWRPGDRDHDHDRDRDGR